MRRVGLLAGGDETACIRMRRRIAGGAGAWLARDFSRPAVHRAGVAALVLVLGAIALQPHGAQAAAQRAQEPPSTYTAHVTGTRSEKGYRERWTAQVTFALAEVESTPAGRIAGLHYYSTGGRVRWKISQGGRCAWSDEFTFQVRRGSNSAELRFSGRTKYAAVIATHAPTVTARAREYDDGRCVDVGLEASPGGDWLEMDDYVAGRAGEPLRGSEAFAFEGWSFQWNFDPGSSAGGLRAVARAPASVERGRTATLDGSRSAPRRRIVSRRWTYTLGAGCPAEARPADGARSTQATTRFVALCTVHALLTVRDRAGRVATDTAVVRVVPRTGALWRAVVNFVTETHTFLPLFAPPVVSRFGDETSLTRGTLRCRDGVELRAFCPAPVTMGGDRYELARVADRGSPFNGWYYVRSPRGLTLDKVAFLNPYLEPDGPPPAVGEPNWYAYNLSRGIRVADARSETLAHEGFGFGVPRSGHMQALVDAVGAGEGHNDPRRYVETRIGPDRGVLQSRTDTCLEEIETAVTRYANDPLAVPSATQRTMPRAFMWSEPFGIFGSWVEADVAHRDSAPARELPVVTCAGR